MLIVGLTGNMGCGKSTVARMLGKFPDTAVVDCDRLAKDIYTSPGFRPVAESILGADIWKDGQLDVNAVAAIFFGDADIRRRLQAAIFPPVFQELTRLENEARQAGKKLFMVESAILFESGLDRRWSAERFIAVCVTCSPEEQRRRLQADCGMTDGQINERLRHQMSMDEKVRRTTVEISSDCRLQKLDERARNLHDLLCRVADGNILLRRPS